MTARHYIGTALPLLVLLLATAFAAGDASAQEPGRGMMPGTIRVTATGESRAAPDRAWIDFGVETSAPTSEAAAADNAQRMERIMTALTRAGVPRADIQTRDYSIYPDYAPPPNGQGEPRLRGYRVSNIVSVQTDRPEGVGSLIDAALGAGANRMHGIRFGLRNPEAARAQALRQAMERGRREAELIATGMGVRLGAILDASTSSEPPRFAPPMMEMAAQARGMAADVATPIQPGQQSVAATVWLTYAIVQ